MSEQFDEKTEAYLQLMDQQLKQEQLRRISLENEYTQVSSFSAGKEPNLAELQLQLDKELDRIYHLLSGNVLVRDSEGGTQWKEPDDDRLIILSAHGVKLIMNLVSFYINKNTLLSIYDIDVILERVRKFGIELADLMFTKYEEIFSYPSPEELYDLYLPLIKTGQYKINEDELYLKCIDWSKEELQNKIRHYNVIVMALVHAVESTYRRALKGETLKSLRTQTHISQNVVPLSQPGSNKGGFNLLKPSTWTGN